MTHRRNNTTELEHRDLQLGTTAMTIDVQRAVEKLPPAIQNAIQSELRQLLLQGNERIYTITLITSEGLREMPADYQNTLPSWAITIITRALTVSEAPHLLAIQIMIGPEKQRQPLPPQKTTRIRASEGPIESIRAFLRSILGPNIWFS